MATFTGSTKRRLLFAFIFLMHYTRSTLGNAVLPFFVLPEDDNVAVVNAAVGVSGETVSCEFSYHTVDRKNSLQTKLQNSNSNQQVSRRSIQKDPSTILGKLSGVCTRKTMDYWKYELCFEAKVTQGHGRDSNNLGVYVRMEGNAQIYEDGSPCEALSEKTGRTSRVEFVCDKNLRLLSIEEVSTCNYRLIVSTPIVCGHSEFQQASSVISPDSKGVEAQSWFLELSETQGQQVICTVSTDSDKPVHFERFELSLYSNSFEMMPVLHQCRSRGRVDLSFPEKHYMLQHTESNTRLTISNGANFQNKLAYVTLEASVN
mmetsp:Transcript_17975/g.21849  ORF Transcript_17975/g.21849 Transcript_17975/m.21849 type:complete len:317 (+) Transcript_17975:1-951(+)